MSAIPFSGGIPTKPDVDRLIKVFGTPRTDEVIPYSEIERELGKKRTEGRFRSVVSQWRLRLMREKNAFLLCVDREGFRQATDDERVTVSASKVKSGLRICRKGGHLAATTPEDNLTSERVLIRDHIAKLGSEVIKTAAEMAAQFKASLPGITRNIGTRA